MAKKTRRVEKWRTEAAQREVAGQPRRGTASGAGSRRPGTGPRRQQSRQRLPLAWMISGVIVVAAVIGIVIFALSGDDEDDVQLAADQTATAVAAGAAEPDLPVDPTDPFGYGPVPTTRGVALANDGDVASGCWTEDQRLTGGTQPLQWSAPPAMVIDPGQVYTAQLVTNYGSITWQLLPGASDVAVNNFICLSRAGYFDGAPFHRIVDGFALQGGDPTGTGTGGPGYSFDSPANGDYTVGAVSMANSGNTSTSGSQFFVNLGDNTASFTQAAAAGQGNGYITFARVIDGQDVVAALDAVEKQDSGRGEISSPVAPVLLESVTIYQNGVPDPAGIPGATPVAGTPVAATPVVATPVGTPIATPGA